MCSCVHVRANNFLSEFPAKQYFCKTVVLGMDWGWTREILGLFCACVAVSTDVRKHCHSHWPALHHLWISLIGARGAEWSDVSQQGLCAVGSSGCCTYTGVCKWLCCTAVIPQLPGPEFPLNFLLELEPCLVWERPWSHFCMQGNLEHGVGD